MMIEMLNLRIQSFRLFITAGNKKILNENMITTNV